MASSLEKHKLRISFQLIPILLVVVSTASDAQWRLRWMNAGALHDFYGENGSETEGQRMGSEKGFEWPAILRFQGMKHARGLWIGAKNFTDETNDFYPYKVITNGPRNPAFWALFPTKFEMAGKFTPTAVSVDGDLSYEKDVKIDVYD